MRVTRDHRPIGSAGLAPPSALTADASATPAVTPRRPVSHYFRANSWAFSVAERIFAPRAGGRVHDRGTDGSECHWGNVIVYEPPTRVVISWNISPRWQIEADRANRSEAEVRFFPETDDRTRVELDHRHLERHGDGWQKQRQELGGEGGWPGCLRKYAERVKVRA